MRNVLLTLTVVSLLLSSCSVDKIQDEIIIDLQGKGTEISPSMYGVFFEEINHAGDGGLYAELVKNRSFEELEVPEGYHVEGERLYPRQVVNHLTGEVNSQAVYRWTTEKIPGWTLNAKEGTAQMKLTKNSPKFATAPNNLEINILDASEPIQLKNGGYWGMGVAANEKYLLRTIIRTTADYKGKITAKLIAENGTLLASSSIETGMPNQWNDFNTTLQPTVKDAKACLVLEFDAPGKVWIDYVSLFPENTFNKRPNGLRKDVAEMLVGLKPAFVRWPGGCVVEGISLENRFEWKKTLGDPAARSGEYSTWGYRCSYGFGYDEMLQFCEDIQADAMFVCNVGLGCQYRMGDACSESSIAYYLDDCLDAIEYALGDETTEWGAKRIASGHIAPYPLKYVEIGNENWGDEYNKRFALFYKVIKEKYPQLILISNHGLNDVENIEETDMIDPHWYVAPEYFYSNTTIFDKHSRGRYTVYVGEYACNQGVGGGNMTAALSEAAFISGMERNGDLVKMTSYAPLLENRNDRSWAVNLIWLDTDKVVGRSSYYVQKMAAENRPTYNLKSSKTMTLSQPKELEIGNIGFGSWETEVEFKDIKVIQNGKEMTVDPKLLTMEDGAWEVSDEGTLVQNSLQQGVKRILKGFKGNEYTLRLKARKIAGKEGFFIYFGMTEDGQKGYAFNIGGWNNQMTAVETVAGGTVTNIVSETFGQTIEAGQWYEIEVKVVPQKVELLMNSNLILTYIPTTPPLQFISSGYDVKAREVVLKVVNGAAKPYQTKIKLEGAEQIEKIGKVISLVAQSGEDENSFEEPRKIYPQEGEFSNFSDSFEYAFPPFSYTVLRVKATCE